MPVRETFADRSLATSHYLSAANQWRCEVPFDEADLRKLVERMLIKARSERSTVKQ